MQGGAIVERWTRLLKEIFLFLLALVAHEAYILNCISTKSIPARKDGHPGEARAFEIWDQMRVLAKISYVTLGKSPNLSVTQFAQCNH